MHIIFLFLTSLFLIVLKAGHAGIRLSDTNIYFYTSWLILHGKLLYKDIFFTNLPVFPYISALYVFLLGNLEWYYLTATLEVIIVGLLIYFITKKRFKDKRNVALTCSFLYIFSFITLSTSDHQSGVFLSSILAMASYFFYIEKRYLLLGISLGITLTIKAYLLPIIIAFFLFLAIKESKNMLISLVSFLITIIIVLTPFVILAGPEFKTNILQYSLVRLPGLSKINIILFFIKHDFALFFLIIFNVLNIKRNLLFFLITLFCAVFILLYQDIYYLYLNIIIPFLCLSYADFHQWAMSYKYKYMDKILFASISIFLITNIYIYSSHYSELGKVNDLNSLIKVIRNEKPDYLYGGNEITPALAYLTNTPLLNEKVDSNQNIYRKGFLNAKVLSTKATQTRTILVSLGATYPSSNINEEIIGDMFDSGLVKKNCKLIESVPVRSEGIENRINLFKCY